MFKRVRALRLRSVLLLVGAMVLGGVAAASAASALGSDQPVAHGINNVSVDHLPPAASGVNKHGQTYGPGVKDGASTDVDLVAAIGDHGFTGYVKEADLDGDIPANIHAVEHAEQLGGIPANQQIPLYAADGTTVLDTFTLSGTPDDQQADHQP